MSVIKKSLLSTAVVVSCVVTSACGWLTGDDGLFRDRGDNYRKARLEEPLQVPPGLSTTSIDDALAIPETRASADLSGTFEVPRPAALEGNPDAERVKLQKLGDDNWLLVEAEPGEVWPRLRQFLNINQLAVVRADASAGVIETAWLQPQAEGSARERYRFRIEQGVQRGSSEVFVLQAAATSGDRWPQQSDAPERENEMMRVLAQFIADSDAEGPVSMLAQRGLDSRGKVFLDKRGERPSLRLELPFSRAWASLESALPKAGFTVDDRNLTEAQLWVRFTPPEEEDDKGWFGSFWAWLFSDDEAIGEADTVYRIGVERLNDNAVRITLRREDGEAIAATDSELLLQEIKRHLS